MICPTCNYDSSRIRVSATGAITCHNCGGFSESGGTKTDKILTRNATRITEDQLQHEGDMITPYVVDKSTNQVVVNEEFINLYPTQAAQTYTPEELQSVGQGNLKPPEPEDTSDIQFNGDEEQAIDAIIQS
jgi:hypothetical protein